MTAWPVVKPWPAMVMVSVALLTSDAGLMVSATYEVVNSPVAASMPARLARASTSASWPIHARVSLVRTLTPAVAPTLAVPLTPTEPLIMSSPVMSSAATQTLPSALTAAKSPIQALKAAVKKSASSAGRKQSKKPRR